MTKDAALTTAPPRLATSKNNFTVTRGVSRNRNPNALLPLYQVAPLSYIQFRWKLISSVFSWWSYGCEFDSSWVQQFVDQQKFVFQEWNEVSQGPVCVWCLGRDLSTRLRPTVLLSSRSPYMPKWASVSEVYLKGSYHPMRNEQPDIPLIDHIRKAINSIPERQSIKILHRRITFSPVPEVETNLKIQFQTEMWLTHAQKQTSAILRSQEDQIYFRELFSKVISPWFFFLKKRLNRFQRLRCNFGSWACL